METDKIWAAWQVGGIKESLMNSGIQSLVNKSSNHAAHQIICNEVNWASVRQIEGYCSGWIEGIGVRAQIEIMNNETAWLLSGSKTFGTEFEDFNVPEPIPFLAAVFLPGGNNYESTIRSWRDIGVVIAVCITKLVAPKTIAFGADFH